MGICTKKCDVCGKELPITDMDEVFTGRVHYICQRCKKVGAKEVNYRHYDYFITYEGKKRINRNKGGKR